MVSKALVHMSLNSHRPSCGCFLGQRYLCLAVRRKCCACEGLASEKNLRCREHMTPRYFAHSALGVLVMFQDHLLSWWMPQIKSGLLVIFALIQQHPNSGARILLKSWQPSGRRKLAKWLGNSRTSHRHLSTDKLFIYVHSWSCEKYGFHFLPAQPSQVMSLARWSKTFRRKLPVVSLCSNRVTVRFANSLNISINLSEATSATSAMGTARASFLDAWLIIQLGVK